MPFYGKLHSALSSWVVFMNTGAAGACFAVVWSRALLDDETYQTNRKCRMTAELLSCWFDYSGSLRRSARAPAGLPCFFFLFSSGCSASRGSLPHGHAPPPPLHHATHMDPSRSRPSCYCLVRFNRSHAASKGGHMKPSPGVLLGSGRNLSCLTGWRSMLDHVLI